MMARPAALAVLACAVALAVAGCGGDDEERDAELSGGDPEALAEAPDSGEDRPAGESRGFWSEERIDEALANPIPLPETPEAVPVPSPKPEGPSESVAPRGPADQGQTLGARPDGEAGDAPPPPQDRGEPPGAPPTDAPEAPGYRLYNFSSEAEAPWRTNGKLLSYYANGRYGSCSASSVTAANQSLVVTAGHCVYDPADGDGWATRILFLPGYRNGARPYGTWPAQYWVTFSGWASSRNWNYDVAMLSVYRNPAGATLQSVVGARGISWNYSVNQYWAPLGYPGESPFDGERLYACDSFYGGARNSSSSGPANMLTGCNMNPGASGGGWMLGGLGGTRVGSVNSTVDNLTSPTEIRGPYFGDAVASLYESQASRATTTEPLPPKKKKKKKRG